ncbi:MAG: DUF4333 domain-containing protein [Acidimicrobiales bacterium]
MRRTLAAAFAVLSLTLLAGACSKGKQVEDKIADSIKSETGLKDVKVTCPGGVKADKGEKVTCTATGDFTPFLSSQGVPVDSNTKVDHVKFDVDFVADNSFSATVNEEDLRSQLSISADASTASSPDTLPGDAST